jgi:hypothetical protein
MNGYQEEDNLSAFNGQLSDSYRQIFSFSLKKGKLYLSTDFEKGAFEVCDEKGRHLGELLFSGVWQNKPDLSGNHNIRLL